MPELDVAAAEPRDRLLERLDDERTVAALERLLDHAEVLAFGAQALDGFVRRGDEIAENLGQGVSELRQLAPGDGSVGIADVPRVMRAGAKLAEVAERPAVQRLLDSGVLEKLGEPGTLAALEALADKAELIAFALQAIDGFVRRGDEVVEAVAESAAELRTVTRGSELASALPRLRAIGRLALEHRTLELITQLTDASVPVMASGILDPALVRTVADAGASLGSAYDEARRSNPTPMGPWAAVRAMRDPDVQRALGFGVALLKQFGRRLPRS